jgi:hypothetical protein
MTRNRQCSECGMRGTHKSNCITGQAARYVLEGKHAAEEPRSVMATDISKEALKGLAMVIDQNDPQADPYLIFGLSNIGTTVKLDQTGHHPEAALRRAVERYGRKYNPIYLVQVLAVHGDAYYLFT